MLDSILSPLMCYGCMQDTRLPPK